jgi:replicative DNA helicase
MISRDELEWNLIGCMLSEPTKIIESGLTAKDFTAERREVFGAFMGLISAGHEIDPFGVAERVPTIGLTTLVHEMRNRDIRTNANFIRSVELLRTENRKDRITELCQAASMAVEQGKSPDKIRGTLINRLSEMDGEGELSRDLGMSEILKQVYDYIEEVEASSKCGRTVGIPTGIIGLDRNVGGMHKSNLIVVGGRPSMGKTAFALSIALHASSHGFKVGFISTEMSGVEVGTRLVSLVSNVPATKLRDASMGDADYEAVSAATKFLDKQTLRVYDNPSCAVSRIVMQARAWKLTRGLDLLIVDYLQRLQSDEREVSRSREVGKFASGMKTVARALEIPVVALSQINRGVTTRSDKRPTMSDLRDSGEIEQEADTIWLLHRESEFDENASKTEAEIIIEKNRHGPTAIVRAEFDPETMRWHSRIPPKPFVVSV